MKERVRRKWGLERKRVREGESEKVKTAIENMERREMV